MLYVAFDGNYGDSDGMVVVDDSNFDDHFYNYLDNCSDWQRPSFAEWFESNEHNFIQGDKDWQCEECEHWLDDKPWGLDASKGYSIYGQETGLRDSDFI